MFYYMCSTHSCNQIECALTPIIFDFHWINVFGSNQFWMRFPVKTFLCLNTKLNYFTTVNYDTDNRMKVCCETINILVIYTNSVNVNFLFLLSVFHVKTEHRIEVIFGVEIFGELESVTDYFFIYVLAQIRGSMQQLTHKYTLKIFQYIWHSKIKTTTQTSGQSEDQK